MTPAITDADPELPRLLRHAFGGRFEAAEVLGSGPHGSVLRARHAIYGEVSVKVLSAHSPDVAEAGALAVQRASDALDHPRVLHILEVLRDGGLVALVTPYLGGGSLESRMARGEAMSWDAICALVRSVAEILDHAHAQHIVHGGVTPSNVMFDAAGRVFLRDFGTTQTFAGMTRDSAAEAYAAPEWWRGHHLSPASDQFSLGVVAMELVTGRRRIDAPGVEGIQVLEPIEIPATAELRPGLALTANRALARALAASPGNRFPSAGDFATALSGASVRGTDPHHTRRISWRGVQLGAVAAAAIVAVLVASDASRRRSAGEGLSAIERGTRGIADGLDAATGRARGAIVSPSVGPVGGGNGTRDATSRVTGATPSPKIPLPDIPPGPSLRATLPSGRAAGSGAAANVAANVAAASGVVGRMMDTLSAGSARTVGAAPTSNATSALGSAITRVGQATSRALDSARARAGNEVPSAATGATITPRLGGGATSPARSSAASLPGGGSTGGANTGGGVGTRGVSSSGGSDGGAAPRSGAGGAASTERAPPTGAASESRDAYLSVSSDQPRWVLVDGVPRGRTPTVIRVSAGAHRVAALGLPKQSVRAVAGDTVSVRLAGKRP